MTDLAERRALRIRQLQPTLQLRLDDPVLRRQVFVPASTALVHRPRHAGQHPRPIHSPPAPEAILGNGIFEPSGNVPQIVLQTATRYLLAD